MLKYVQSVEENGFAIVPQCLVEQMVEHLCSQLGYAKHSQRNLLGVPVVRELAASEPVKQLTAALLGKFLGLEPNEVKANIVFLQDALEKAVDFFATQLHVVTTDFLPQSHQLIPITYFFSRINSPSVDQLKTLKQWFWRTSFSLRYSGATDTRLNQDIDLIDRIAQGEQEIPQRYGQLPPDKILIGAPFTRTNVYTRSLLLLMAQASPLNLTNGAKVDIGPALSKYNSKEYHHIFPRAFLKDRGVEFDKINSVCNFCFLPSDSNKKISRKAPSDYVFNLIPPLLYDRIMSSNLLPLEKDIYEKDDFDTFLRRRAEVILKFLGDQAS